MRKGAVTIGAALLVGAIVAAMVPLWMMTAGTGLLSAGWGAVALMIVCCIAIGGGLTLLIFSRARRADHGAVPASDDSEVEPGRQD